MLTDEDKENQLKTALRMSTMYKDDTRYTARQRAVDHAFSYDLHEEGHEYWLGVVEHLEKMARMNKGVKA